MRAIEFMQWNQEYNPVTHEVKQLNARLEIPEGIPVYFEDAELAGITSIFITYKYTINGVESTKRLSFTSRSHQEYKPKVFLEYYLNSDTNKYSKYFFYAPGSGEFPSLDKHTSTGYRGKHYPIAPIKVDKVNTQDLPDSSNLKKTTAKLIEHVGLDLKKLTEDLDSDPDNPDNLKHIDDIYLMVAVDITTKTNVGIRYLMDHFVKLQAQLNPSKQEFDAWVASGYRGYYSGSGFNTIADSQFNQNLIFNYVTEELKTGQFGPIGHRDSYISYADRTELKGSVVVEHSTIRFREQLTLSSYREVLVHGPRQVTRVIPKTTDAYLAKATAEPASFLIPLEFGLVKQYKSQEEALLLQESIHLVIHSVQKTRLKWYQTKIFGAIFMVVMIVIAIITLQPQIAAIAAAATFTAAALLTLQLVLTTILVRTAVNYIADLLVKHLGGELALVIAAIAAAVAIAYGDTSSLQGLPFAEELLMVATSLTTSISEDVKEQLLDLTQEASDFFASAEEKQEELDKAQDGLDPNVESYLIADSIIYIDTNETPDEYYERTIGQGNIGILALDAVRHYVDGALTLPKLN